MIMTIKIINQESNSVEVDFGELDHSIPHLLVERLTNGKDVEFVAYKVDHPVISTPCFILKTKKGDALKLLVDTLEEIQKEVAEFKKQFSDISK